MCIVCYGWCVSIHIEAVARFEKNHLPFQFVVACMALIHFSERGIYCPQADVYIDPWLPVDKALITHGHSDHARWGHRHYLCTHAARPVIQYRLGHIAVESVHWGEPVHIHGVRFSFHPAGHIPGSAQIRVAHKGEVWVISGDYKTAPDGISEPFEPLPCQHFVTESTFGLPVYRWRDQVEIMQDINAWWRHNQAQGKTSVLIAYALGKAQRILANLEADIGPILTHGAVENINEVLRAQGLRLPPTQRVEAALNKHLWPQALVLAPPSALNTPWMNRFKAASIGIASGWMALRGARRRRAADRGFVLSDHADWPGLQQAIAATGAERIYVTHGYTDIFAQYLRQCGLQAQVVDTRFSGESLDAPEPEMETP